MNKPTSVRLSPKARLRWDPWEEKYVLLYPERGLVLNGAAHAVLALCDGLRSPEEMAEIIARRFAIEDTERVRGAVSAFLERLEKLGLLETDAGGLS